MRVACIGGFLALSSEGVRCEKGLNNERCPNPNAILVHTNASMHKRLKKTWMTSMSINVYPVTLW